MDRIRVFQVATGNVGTEMVRRLRRQPDLDAKPDCVTFHGVWPDLELYERVLEAGIDIVTTADFTTGHHRNANHPTPSGRTEAQVIAAGVRARRLDLLRHRHEPRPRPDPHHRPLGRRHRHRERHLHRVGRRLLPPLRRHLAQLRLRHAGRRPGGPAPAPRTSTSDGSSCRRGRLVARRSA